MNGPFDFQIGRLAIDAQWRPGQRMICPGYRKIIGPFWWRMQ